MDNTISPSKVIGILFAGILGLVVLIGGCGVATSFKGTEPGQTCVVKGAGLFESNRGVKKVRKGGEGVSPIGPWNKQHCLPSTERDSNDVIEGNPTFPTKDSVQVVADGQMLFKLTSDPKKVEKFYNEYARRDWSGKMLWESEGWLSFLKQRVAPVVLDAQREVIGQFNCTDLNNLCVYVQNPEAAVSAVGKDGKTPEPTTSNTQNLSKAQQSLVTRIQSKLRAAFGDDYFENIRYQNLRIRFENEVQGKITEAQSLRTQAVNAKLEAERKRAEAKGEADRKVEEAEGAKRAAREQAKAYRSNPVQAQIDRIKAFCGEDGCDPQVMSGGGDVIAQLGKGNK